MYNNFSQSNGTFPYQEYNMISSGRVSLPQENVRHDSVMLGQGMRPINEIDPGAPVLNQRQLLSQFSSAKASVIPVHRSIKETPSGSIASHSLSVEELKELTKLRLSGSGGPQSQAQPQRYPGQSQMLQNPNLYSDANRMYNRNIVPAAGLANRTTTVRPPSSSSLPLLNQSPVYPQSSFNNQSMSVQNVAHPYGGNRLSNQPVIRPAHEHLVTNPGFRPSPQLTARPVADPYAYTVQKHSMLSNNRTLHGERASQTLHTVNNQDSGFLPSLYPRAQAAPEHQRGFNSYSESVKSELSIVPQKSGEEFLYDIGSSLSGELKDLYDSKLSSLKGPAEFDLFKAVEESGFDATPGNDVESKRTLPEDPNFYFNIQLQSKRSGFPDSGFPSDGIHPDYFEQLKSSIDSNKETNVNDMLFNAPSELMKQQNRGDVNAKPQAPLVLESLSNVPSGVPSRVHSPSHSFSYGKGDNGMSSLIRESILGAVFSDNLDDEDEYDRIRPMDSEDCLLALASNVHAGEPAVIKESNVAKPVEVIPLNFNGKLDHLKTNFGENGSIDVSTAPCTPHTSTSTGRLSLNIPGDLMIGPTSDSTRVMY